MSLSLWVLSEVVCASLLGSDKCLKHCMSKKLQLRLLSFSCQLPFSFLPSYHRSCTDCWYMNTSLSKGKYFLCLHSESWSDQCWLSWLLYPAAALHSNARHQGERVHTCYQSPKLGGLEDCGLLKVQHKLGHIQRLLTERFQHNPVSYPGRKIKFCREHYNSKVQLPNLVDKQNCHRNGLTSTD